MPVAVRPLAHGTAVLGRLREYAARGRMVECIVCFGSYAEEAGAHCTGAGAHFLCNGCIVGQVRSACTATAAGPGSEFFTAATNKNGVPSYGP